MIGNIFKFAWRNIWRNKRRTLITVTAITFGVIVIVFAKAYINGVMNSATESMVKTELGHIKIAHREYIRLERIMPKEHLVDGIPSLTTSLSQVDGTKHIVEKLKMNVLLNHENITEAGLAIGIHPADAEQTLDLSKAIIEGTFYTETGLQLVIGKGLAEELDAKVNDELLLITTDINYSTYALPFKIAGIFETGFKYMDKHQLYFPLSRAQEMLDCPDSAHEVLIFIDNPTHSRRMAAHIQGLLDRRNPGHNLLIQPWEENGFIKSSVPLTKKIYGRIYGLIMLIVALVILNTMLMTVMERYHEIGVIKALGMKNREISLMILSEALYIGVIGSLAGGAIGGALAAYTGNTGINIVAMTSQKIWDEMDIPIPMFGQYLYPEFTWGIVCTSVGFGLIMALLAVIYPAVKSARMKPVEAFRSQLDV
jgi:putative ABC transport system permease protein